MDQHLMKALRQLDNAANNLADSDPDTASAAWHARRTVMAISNALRYGPTYAALSQSNAALFATAVIKENKST